ncbi:MAG TPA: hypothetical protein VFU02_15920 [Polyangiaceae bacterium]|nr:hypothetical protein [Polyangiaceae bacterium]
MADLLNNGALPIGFLMFFGMAFAFVKRRATHKLASKAFPELAARLGLVYKPSPYRRGIGTLSGTFQGYRVFVDPDEQRKVSLHFEGTPAVLLRSYTQNQRPPAELGRLYSGDRSFDAFFKTRYASDAVAERIQQYKQWRPLITALEGEFRRELTQFNVSETGITLVVNFGNPPHIPGGAVERLLETMVRFASVIDPLGPVANSSETARA